MGGSRARVAVADSITWALQCAVPAADRARLEAKFARYYAENLRFSRAFCCALLAAVNVALLLVRSSEAHAHSAPSSAAFAAVAALLGALALAQQLFAARKADPRFAAWGAIGASAVMLFVFDVEDDSARTCDVLRETVRACVCLCVCVCVCAVYACLCVCACMRAYTCVHFACDRVYVCRASGRTST